MMLDSQGGDNWPSAFRKASGSDRWWSRAVEWTTRTMVVRRRRTKSSSGGLLFIYFSMRVMPLIMGETTLVVDEDISETFHFIFVSRCLIFTAFSPTIRKSGVMSCDISTELIDVVVDETWSCCRAFTFVCAVMC